MRGTQTRLRFDVAVVGAGPAGASAARQLAARGARVVLLERERLPRYKTCGGGVVLRAARNADLPPGVPRGRALHTAELHFHDADLHFSVRREGAILWATMRSDLDAGLCAAAARAGAEVRDACNVTSLETERDGVRLHTSNGFVSARFVVAADGAASRTARRAGWRPVDRGVPAIEVELPGDSRAWQRYAHAARFDFGTVPSGYAWVFPKRSHLSIGILRTQRGKVTLRRLLERYASRLHIPLDAQAEWHGALIPLAPRRPLSRGRVLLCGDAAGLVDPVTCEGISHALRSGALVAQAITDAGDRAADAGKRYHAALRRDILPELRRAHVLANVLYRNVALRNWLFRRLGQSLCEAMVDVITGARTYGDLLGSPKSYGKLVGSALQATAR
jgi:geranylgeranyl reductase family protein